MEPIHKPFVNSYNISTVDVYNRGDYCSLVVTTGNQRYGTIRRKGDCQTIYKMYEDVKQCLEAKRPIWYIPPEIE